MEKNFLIENNNIEIPTNISSSTSNVFSITNDNIVNDFITQNVSLESLIEKELYRTKL